MLSFFLRNKRCDVLFKRLPVNPPAPLQANGPASIDHVGGRETQRLECLLGRDEGWVEPDRKSKTKFFHELQNILRGVAVVDGEDGEALPLIFFIKDLQCRHLFFTWFAPGSPQINQYNLPAIVGQRMGDALYIGESQFRGGG